MEELIHDFPEFSRRVQELGLLPLLESGVKGFSAMEMVDEDCRYHTDPDTGFSWPLWDWKGPVIREGDCVYGHFFEKKAGFVSAEWWPDLMNWRRSLYGLPQEASVEESVLEILEMNGSLITRDLRKACGFTAPGMRGMFGAYVNRLEMACRIVTEDFVYPRDRQGRPYGWGLALLTTPERLYGRQFCHCPRTPEESRQRIWRHFREILPQATDRQIDRMVGLPPKKTENKA